MYPRRIFFSGRVSRHQNEGYAVTGPESLDYYEAAKIFSEELGRKSAYANPAPLLAQRYWVILRPARIA